jgi:hypothetical protein
MKQKIIPFGVGVLFTVLAILPEQSCAQEMKNKPVSTQVKDTIVDGKKEEKNRNEMLNAASATLPRQINIGIPAGGDIQILENDLPVIYQFYPQMVMSVWKYDSSMGRIGLLSLGEGALTFGKVGFSVNSYDRDPGTKFKGYFSAYTNNWGTLTYSANISGPIGKKGWGYQLGLFETYDHGNGVNRMYSRWAGERMEMVKAGISKKYKNGVVKVLFKHASDVTDMNNLQPLIYEGNGNFSEYPGFKLGRDSYTIGDGNIAYADANTGESVKMNIGDTKFTKTTSSTIYLNGEHKFKDGLKLTYSSMYMNSKSPFSIQFPLTLGISTPDANNKYYLHGTNTEYTDQVQMVMNQTVEPTTINQSLSRFELTKKYGVHNLRIGLTEQYYATGLSKTNSALYYQTVAPNPVLLDWKKFIPAYNMTVPVTNSDGIVGIPGSITKTTVNKTAVYVSDDFKVGKIFDFTIGARLERQDGKDLDSSPYANEYINDRPLLETRDRNRWNHVGIGNFIAKVTNKFGFLGDVTYNDYYSPYNDYPDAQKDVNGQPIAGAQRTVRTPNQIKVMFLGLGTYYNYSEKFSIVSKITSSSKRNNVTGIDVFDPANSASRINVYPIFYDIETLGWTTDVVASPFKNFNLHYLITLQNPLYKNYNYSAYGQSYSYNNNNTPALSKVLMEIDPSYKMGDFKIWASLRFFGKQYGNLTNSIYYNSWWENFAGVDYRLSSSCSMKLQVVNFLDQKGVSGAMQGADQITSAMEPSYIGSAVNARGIRPRTIEFTINFKI